jgi:GTPase SAR1 family protein
MTKVEFSAPAKLREAGKPMILVFNKIDQYPEVDRLAIYEKIASERVKELLSPDENRYGGGLSPPGGDG